MSKFKKKKSSKQKKSKQNSDKQTERMLKDLPVFEIFLDDSGDFVVCTVELKSLSLENCERLFYALSQAVQGNYLNKKPIH